MKTILAAVDFSDATRGVIDMSLSLANAYGARLHLLHVVEPEPSYTAYGFTPDEFPALHAYQEKAKLRAVEKMTSLAASSQHNSPGLDLHTHVEEGSPLHVILEQVKTIDADLVILGSHGHGVIASLLLGSVAEGMVRKASAPTLIVPAGKETSS